jgi:dinuclear metal center YbgI/SA1388 family protein
MNVADLSHAMERIAPSRFAEDWDNVGLLIGDPDRPLDGPVVLTIDLTEQVVDEAAKQRAAAIIAYHPPIFKPIRRLTAATGRERVLLRAIESKIAIYSPHTAIDSAPGGMTDWLADGLLDRKGIVKADRRALRPRIEREFHQQVKIVTFIPEEKVDDIRAALATAGAGNIGNYELCSFSSHGTGTFQGNESSHPSVGQPGKLERVHEIRLEMVCSEKALPLAITTLRQFHPYEEPAIDVYPLVGKPERLAGVGRRLVLDQPATIEKLAERIKTHLGIPTVKVAIASDKPITYVGVVPGAGAEVAPLALADGCQAFLTGEMKHHEVLPMLEAGMSVLLAGHTNTERGYLPRLAERLATELPSATFVVSKTDRSPFTWR